jgi:aspartate/methionine/tyrosine aminotransferase
MKIETFAMERMQSTYENQVEINLSESGVHPLRVEELLDREEDRRALLAQELLYPQSNGTPELRARLAGMYPGAGPDHIEVTNGGSEANFVSVWHLVDPGAEVVMMVPNYMQAWGLARGFGGRVHPWRLRETVVDGALRWRPDLDELRSLAGPGTKLILICNPNNPTGARLSEPDLNAICEIAGRSGAWVLSDEIYRGAELDGRETPSIWGRYERAIVTSGLSKAYGLPGLRIGWIAGPPALIARLWSYHDYTSIAPGTLSDLLARVALAPARRAALLERTRGIIRANYPLVRDWAEATGCGHIAPEAGAIAFIRYRQAVNSLELIETLRRTYGVLIVPGDHFEMDGYFRIGFGSDAARLREGLRRLETLLSAVSADAAR